FAFSELYELAFPFCDRIALRVSKGFFNDCFDSIRTVADTANRSGVKCVEAAGGYVVARNNNIGPPLLDCPRDERSSSRVRNRMIVDMDSPYSAYTVVSRGDGCDLKAFTGQ